LNETALRSSCGMVCIFCGAMRKTSQSQAEARIQDIASLPIQVVGIGDDLVTGDPDFKWLEKEIKITWLK